ncbi:methyl-accepting chemotaxis protein [Pseudomonas citri]|uniref:methyl-accepting chemotaxis protein n=1 Tax=Pseudomonas citri TaxID=2978349 RepID=UPI0021B6BE3B|nr:methyl-accepting chemotaxis protein [Pseudomonas citri]
MSRGFALEHLTVTRKLALGFGLLLALAVLLALTGFYGLRGDGQSLTRINRLGSLFDQTVFSRDANFVYALTADSEQLARHDANLKTMQQMLSSMLDDIRAGGWPQEDLGAVRRLDEKLRAYIDTQHRRQSGPENAQVALKLNESLASLQGEINELYAAEENRAKSSVDLVLIILGAVTLFSLALGGLIAWGIGRQIVIPLQQTLQASERIANGDLTVELHSDRADELGQLLRSINNMSRRLRDVISQIGGSSHRLAASASQLATITTQTRAGIDSQKSETDLVATAMNEMTSTVLEVARHSENAAGAAKTADLEASNALEVSQQAVVQIETLAREVGMSAESMTRLHQESERIGGVLDVIKTVAGQTNLLALNAAIEAARAGEAGRGFAVVADEVRSLAQRTQQSSEEIENLIEGLQRIAEESSRMMQTSVQQTRSTVTGVRDTGEALATITQQVSNIQQMSMLIATAAEEQTAVAEEINRSVLNVRETADQSAEASAEIAASSVELAQLGGELQGLVSRFTV